jgi:hypothetical protein
VGIKVGGQVIASGPADLNIGLWQGYRERDPYVTVTISESANVNFELAEAAEAARLLADPPRSGDWEQAVLSMMDADAVSLPRDSAHVRAFPFIRPPVFAVQQVLETVTVFCHAGRSGEQAPRYLSLTPSEATELAGYLTALVREANGASLGDPGCTP